MSPLLFVFFLGVAWAACPAGYQFQYGKCYRFASLGRAALEYGNIINECAKAQGTLPIVNNASDLKFFYEKALEINAKISVLFPPTYPLNARRPYNLYFYVDKNSQAQNCEGHPTRPVNEYNFGDTNWTDFSCRVLAANNGVPCIWSEGCRMYVEPIACAAAGESDQPVFNCSYYATVVNNACKCNPGYTDILDTNQPDRGQYQRGELCISNKPCQNINRPSTVVFLVDASYSIQPAGWRSVVSFLQSAANILPSNFRVNFIKFANTTSTSPWVDAPWTPIQFMQAVPTSYEPNGQTNTPAALNAANEVLRMDSSSQAAVVLITDGLPFTTAMLEQYGSVNGPQMALDETKAAARRITNIDYFSLVALGFGPYLQMFDSKTGTTGAQNIRNWLLSPNDDYLDYKQTADQLNEAVMTSLLQKACRRFLK